jgi:hypothetical protein
VFFADRAVVKKNTAAATNTTIARPINTPLAWCLAGVVFVSTACRVPVEVPLTVTVGKTWFFKLMPVDELVVSRLEAVPGWTPPEVAAAPEGPTEACGVCVLAWLVGLPLPPVIGSAIRLYCIAKRLILVAGLTSYLVILLTHLTECGVLAW